MTERIYAACRQHRSYRERYQPTPEEMLAEYNRQDRIGRRIGRRALRASQAAELVIEDVDETLYKSNY